MSSRTTFDRLSAPPPPLPNTICAECENHYIKGSGKRNGERLCGATAHLEAKERNVITGEWEYGYAVEDNGMKSSSHFNSGRCKEYVKGEPTVIKTEYFRWFWDLFIE